MRRQPPGYADIPILASEAFKEHTQLQIHREVPVKHTY
jgi:hypothetical protein